MTESFLSMGGTHSSSGQSNIVVDCWCDYGGYVEDRARSWTVDSQDEGYGAVKCIYLLIVGVGKWLQEMVPDGLVFADVLEKTSIDFSVVSFGFPVDLWVICGDRLASDAENVKGCFPEL